MVGVAWAALCPRPATAQSPPFSNTLRWGTGYLDVPAATVLPSLGFRLGFSGFRVPGGASPLVDDNGRASGSGRRDATLHGDATLSLGLWDRLELGTSLQSFNDDQDGGNLVGLFGRILLLEPSRSGFALAAGARYLNAPSFPDGDRAVPRLGFPDSRLRPQYPGGPGAPGGSSASLPGVNAQWSAYLVSSLFLPGLEAEWMPENTVSLTLGWGSGLFREGGSLPWYSEGSWGGWFGGAGLNVELGDQATGSFFGEWSGLDANIGAEVAWRSVRAGVHLLGMNHGENVSAWRSRKVGLSVSITACPLLRRACRPGIRRSHRPDTVRLPAPPPDTVRVPSLRSDTARVSMAGPKGRRDGMRRRFKTQGRQPARSVDRLLQHPIQRVQDRDGGARGEFVFGVARLGAEEPVLLTLKAGGDRCDHHPGIEGADGLDAPEVGVHHLAEDASDGVQRGLGAHAQVSLTGTHARGAPLDLFVQPSHGDGDGTLTIGRRVEIQTHEFESAAGSFGRT